MIEKVRISLWDIFTFFMTGVLFLAALIAVSYSLGNLVGTQIYIDKILKLPITFIVVVIPILLTLTGLIVEPFANYFERYIGKFIYFWINVNEDKRKPDAEVMEEYIKSHCLGDLCGKIDKPFALCKEYVETKQLSTTFMVFLARYGFYRNSCFIVLTSGLYYFSSMNGLIAYIVLIATYIVSAILMKRADEFYSYQAPAIYSAFLIDNLNWQSKSQDKDIKDE